MRKVIACIFLTIFSFQILPVKELGKLLFKSVMTEEVIGHDVDVDGKVKKEIDFYTFAPEKAPHTDVLGAKISVAIHYSDGLQDCHVPDILTPPPNC